MEKKMIAAGTFASLVLAGAAIGTVSAQTAAEATGLTEEQAIEIALMEVPGEVQEVELEREDGMQIYEVEVLTDDGVEMEIEIAADTGAILEVEADGKDGCDKKGDRT